MNAGEGEVLVRTPRLVLRTARASDAANEFRWRRDPELIAANVWKYVPTSYTEFLDRFAAELCALAPERGLLELETADGEHIGHLSYYNGDRLASAVEFGISINEARARGMGLGFEATNAFLGWAFDALPYQIVYLHTRRENERALRCFARAGFVETGQSYRDDEWLVRMELLRERWLAGVLAGERGGP